MKFIVHTKVQTDPSYVNKYHFNLFCILQVRNRCAKKCFRCNQCGSYYSSKRNLAAHEKLHKGVYPYHCQICGKGCGSTTQLRGHMTSHTGKMLYRCPECGKEFGYKQHFKYHVFRHKVSNGSLSS